MIKRTSQPQAENAGSCEDLLGNIAVTPRGPSRGVSGTNVLEFNVPMPPSINACFAERRTTKEQHRRGRITTREYANWKFEAGHLLNIQLKRRTFSPKTRWSIHVIFYFPVSNYNKSDLDNRLKPLIDLLSKHTGLKDNYLMKITAVKGSLDSNCACGEIYIEE
jgi:Holliday junction resolvase RusA-like endonuclease